MLPPKPKDTYQMLLCLLWKTQGVIPSLPFTLEELCMPVTSELLKSLLIGQVSPVLWRYNFFNNITLTD